MTQVHAGSCLCGAVKFQIDGAFEGFFMCHCSRCRKGTGSAYASNLFATKAKLTWPAGAECVKTYGVPGTRHQRSFCIACGGALPGEHMNGAYVVVPAGSLDTPVDIRPTAHICMSSRAAWDEALEAVPKMDGLPG